MTMTDDERYGAVQQRDAVADGTFYYAVKTTGVYCRPSCGARLAKRENVSFFETPEAAERAGFRACKRCRPRGEDDRERLQSAIALVCAHIDRAPEIPKLDALAALAGLSPHHFHRAFVRALGVTPRKYAIARRAEQLGAHVRSSPRVVDAGYESGFGSNSVFYEGAPRALGMTPTAFRNHGVGETVRVACVTTSLGTVLVAGTARGICAVRFGSDEETLRAEVRSEFSGATFDAPDAAFDAWVRAIVRGIESDDTAHDPNDEPVPLDLRGTVFQRRVWEAIASIPRGERISYAELARRLGSAASTRAVASAVGANPAAVVVPCHRVVGSNGAMRGYRWGIERKIALLAREASCG